MILRAFSNLLAEFKDKVVIDTVTVTIPEGYTTDDIISLFVDRYGIGTREGFVDVIQNYEFDFWFVKELEENGIPRDGSTASTAISSRTPMSFTAT